MSQLSITARKGETSQGLGKPAKRIDGLAKVTGGARYAADHVLPNMVFGSYVTAPISMGTITSIDTAPVLEIPGVLRVFTHENAPEMADLKPFAAGGTAQQSKMILQSPEVLYHGMPVALVVAETLEAAEEGARRLEIKYDDLRSGALTLGADNAESIPYGEANPDYEDIQIGDADAAEKNAAHLVQGTYTTPTQHHHPMETYSTTVAWDGPRLTVYEPSQFLVGMQNGIAEAMGIEPMNVHVISPFVGGAFGCKATVTPHLAMNCAVSRQLGRPLKVALGREQHPTMGSFRSPAKFDFTLGCDAEGKLTVLRITDEQLTSRFDPVHMNSAEPVTRIYACPNILGKVRLTRADCPSPGFMRAPAETPGMFPLEVAMDELAEKAGIDPVEFRIMNEPDKDPVKNLPYSSRMLVQCLERGRDKFGWSDRPKQPKSVEKDGAWVGYGVATALYPTNISVSFIELEYDYEGHVKISTAAHDLGTGQWTVVGQVASECLGVPLSKITVSIGDSDLPAGALAGGSATTPSISRSIYQASRSMAERLGELSAKMETPPFSEEERKDLKVEGAKLVTKSGTSVEIAKILEAAGETTVLVRANNPAPGMGTKGLMGFMKGKPVLNGFHFDDHTVASWGAHFVEVRVDKLTRTIRVPRMLGVYAAGTIVNPLTARSQMIGGMIWGLGAGLLEETMADTKRGTWVNKDIAEYLIACHADAMEIESEFLDEKDTVANPLGTKGIGELGIVGINAAIANAVYNATGIRVRDLPLRLEKLLDEA
ncbi:xanthine dehydrogenase family protein molybdopterin-binding subunit [Haloferula sargassicola]|uniref:Aldehyde oxidoreductase molybdenum-binding subunit PaoC n=1 Tax=Haloferula sargassicola TaxID=490096 RepID=A0ABP9UXG6_9BACT